MATALEPRRATEAEKQGSDRSFGYVFAMVFAVIGLFPLWRLEAPRWWCLAIAALFAVFAALFPHLLHPLNRVWLALGKLLHKIVSPLVMGAVFFLVRDTDRVDHAAARPRPAVATRHPEQSSYWIEREVLAQPPSETMKKQF